MAMTRTTLTAIGVISLTLALAGAPPALARQSQDAQATEAVSSMVATTATVSAIDKQARIVTLKTADGREVSIDVPADFDLRRLKVGDEVDVEYYEALAVELQPPGTPMAGPKEEAARHRTPSGGVRARVVTVTAEVVSVDPAKNQVTFRGPKGKTETITVQDPQMQEKARQLKPGDKVQFKYTQATALSIKPAQGSQPQPQP
jgi:Cu/Ag efflux protein CusF